MLRFGLDDSTRQRERWFGAGGSRHMSLSELKLGTRIEQRCLHSIKNICLTLLLEARLWFRLPRHDARAPYASAESTKL